MSIFSSSLGTRCSLLCGLGGQPEVCLCLAVAGYLDEGALLDTAHSTMYTLNLNLNSLLPLFP